MENNYLDGKARELLENLEATFNPGHWEQMEQLLNDPLNADLSENSMDHGLRQQLSDLEPKFNSQHWNLFEQQLDAEIHNPEIEDVFLDGVTYELLNELEAPYDPAHWPIMEHRIEEAFSFRRKLIRYKVAELALVALAIFTLIQFLPLDRISAFRLPLAKKSTLSPSAEAQSSIAESLLANPAELSKQPATSIASDISDEEITKIADNLSEAAAEVSDSDATTGLEEGSSITVGPETAPSRHSAQPLAAIEAIPATIITSKASDPVGLLEENLNPDKDIVSPTTSAESDFPAIASLAPHLSNVPIIKGLEISPLRAKAPDLLPHCLECDVWKGPSYLRVGMMGTGDLNYVMTPFIEEYGKRGYNRFEPGYGGGLTLGFKFGRWEIESGALYVSKYYDADTINITINKGNIGSGYEGTGWRGTQIDLLRIPVRSRYGISQKGKWHLYAQGGVAINLAMNRIHSRQVYRVGPPPPTSLRSPDNSALSSSAYEDVNENIGILNNGRVLSNATLSVDLGVGIERFLSSRFSVFAQPVFHYQPFENELGLNRERINTLSLEAGVRVSLKKNVLESNRPLK